LSTDGTPPEGGWGVTANMGIRPDISKPHFRSLLYSIAGLTINEM